MQVEGLEIDALLLSPIIFGTLTFDSGKRQCINRAAPACEFIGPVAGLGVDALVGEDAPFRVKLLLSSDYVTLSEKRKCHPG